jgi:hypothetical protein
MPTDYNTKREQPRQDNKKRYVNQPQHHGWEELTPQMKSFWSDFSNLAYRKTGRYPKFTSGKRTAEQKVGKAHKTSKHNEGNAIDMSADFAMYNILYNTPDGLNLLNSYNLGVLDETNPEAMDKTGATGPHYHIGTDPGLVSKTKQRYNSYTENGTIDIAGLERDLTQAEFKIYAPAAQQLEEDIAVEVEKEEKKEEKEEKSESRKKVSPNKEKSFFADIKIEQEKQQDFEPFQDTPETKVPDILSDYSSISSYVQTSLPKIPSLFKEITTGDLDKMQDGGEIISSYGWDYKKEGDKYLTKRTGSENWIEATGEPLKAIKQKIYNEIPYTKEDKQSEYVNNVKQLINKGYTLDNLVEKRIGTKEGLLNLFPELSSNKKEAEKSKEGEVRFKSSNRLFENKISNDILDVDTRLKFEINLDNIKERAKLDLKNRSSNLTQNETSEQPSPKREYEISPENLVEATRQFNENKFVVEDRFQPTKSQEESEKLTYRETSEETSPKREYEISPENLVEATRKFNEEVKPVSETPTSLPNLQTWQDVFNSKANEVSLPKEDENVFDVERIKLNNSIYSNQSTPTDPLGRPLEQPPSQEEIQKSVDWYSQTAEDKGLKTYTEPSFSLRDVFANSGNAMTPFSGETLDDLTDPESKVSKVATYLKEAPWLSYPTELPEYFSQLQDTKDRSDGINLTEEKVVETPKLDIDVIKNKKQFFDEFPIVKESSNNESFLDDVEDPYKKYKPSVPPPTSTQRFIFNKDTKDIDKDALYNASNRFENKVSIGKSYEDTYGQTYSKQLIDMSDGILVTYQPRQEREDERTDVKDALFISDYLYDQDFTDGYKHEYAENELNKLKNDVLNNKKTERKFATVRIPTGNENEFIAKVVNIKDLTEDDFENNNVYRQSWAKLSDLEISNDGKKVKLNSGDTNFINQGILLTTKQTGDNSHTLRVSGGEGNYGDRWLEIDKLNEFGPYLGGTVTIVSDDGKIVKKVTGGLNDILDAAFAIKKSTNNKEVHFLQSDSGSMNVKPLAKDGVIDKRLLGTQRNKEDWAGASEILLNK